jgi:YVTN family beta-propeller protein
MDPYNLYFTPDGSKAIVVAEVLRRLDFRDPHSWQLIRSVNIPWPGVDHLDFSADGTYLLAGTEYSGVVVKVDTVNMEMTGAAIVGGLPIDVRVSPDGSVFYVANQGRHGVSVVDPVAMKEIQFLPTGQGAHGLQVSRDTRSLYVSNRLAGSISVIDFATRRVTATWNVGGSPDMLQLSPDGRQLWASGRFEGAVYVIDTVTGALLHKIRAGAGAHGLSYFPNTGRISTGHNGVYR